MQEEFKMAAITNLKPGDILEGKYEILKKIGQGGMSVVYLAMNIKLNKQWAVKEVQKNGFDQVEQSETVHKLIGEAEMMKKLDHHALPTIVDIIDKENFIYIVMDYIEGQSLDKILKEYGPQPEEVVIGWAKQLCDALSFLHAQKPPIVYRDMKPSNVMLKPEGNIKIIDFGIAREYKDDGQNDTTILGTKGYAPPEQYNAQSEPRSDIFALGMTMHHLLTGVDPKRSEYKQVRAWNSNCSEGIEAIIDKCVQPAIENRYQNCADLLYDLEHPEYITKEYKKKQKRQMRLFVGSSALCIFALTIGIVTQYSVNHIQNSTYENLISVVSSTSLEGKMEKYKQAIDIYPYDTTAYLLILEAFESEGRFDKEENDQFLALYNANKDGFQQTSKEFAELNYRIGMMYFNYYTNNGNVSFSNRVQKAYSFFEQNHREDISSDFTQKNLSDCYYQICSFFKRYVLNSSIVEEASKESYEELFNVLSKSLEEVKEMEGASTYDQLSLYNGIFLLLYDQRNNMVSVNVDQDSVVHLLDQVYEDAKPLNVQKEQSKRLQGQILDNYQIYREAIIRSYTNSKERR